MKDRYEGQRSSMTEKQKERKKGKTEGHQTEIKKDK